jgi:ribosomal RNA-processing protein 8
VSLISSIGFKLKTKVRNAQSTPLYALSPFIIQDDSNSHFTLFEFKKVARAAKMDKEWSKVMSMGDILKPCEYKRR